MGKQGNPVFSLDRKEGNVAVLYGDSGERIEVSASLLPADAKEGDLFLKDESGNFSFLAVETEKKRADVASRLESLWEE